MPIQQKHRLYLSEIINILILDYIHNGSTSNNFFFGSLEGKEEGCRNHKISSMNIQMLALRD